MHSCIGDVRLCFDVAVAYGHVPTLFLFDFGIDVSVRVSMR